MKEIAIISEHRYTQEEIKKFKEQGVAVNYTLLPQFYQNYSDTLNSINHKLIKASKGIIFRLENYYKGTQDAIEYALYLKKQIKVITPEASYNLHIMEDWKHSHKDFYTNKTHTFKHPILQDFESKRKDYFENKTIEQLKEQRAYLTENINVPESEVEKFVKTFAPQYKLDVDYQDFHSLHNAYMSLNFYIDNNISYDLPQTEMYKGSLTPEEAGFNPFLFQDPIDLDLAFEEEFYGDMNLMSDIIYKERTR